MRSSLSAVQCRQRAEELRTLSDSWLDGKNRDEMIRIAASYDRMAEDREINDRMNATLDASRREAEERARKG